MTLHRFFIPSHDMNADRVVFPSDTSHQIRTVLRLRPGELVVVFNGTGLEMVVRLEEVSRSVMGVVEERRPNRAEPTTSITLCFGLLKGSKTETVLQKCTEIGVDTFVPMITQRSVPSTANPERQRRWEAIVGEAAEQSGRGRVPDILAILPFEAALDHARRGGQLAIAWEEAAGGRVPTAQLDSLDSPISLFIGPEGGFTRDEVQHAHQFGAQVITLGRRILRAETAAMVACALILAAHGDME